jgi:hypothetical protein
MNNTMGWKAECEEWQAISKERLDAPLGHIPKYESASKISFEQRKRMFALGQRPMTYPEIINEMERAAGLCTCEVPAEVSPTGPCVEFGVWFGPLEDGLNHQYTCAMVIAYKRARNKLSRSEQMSQDIDREILEEAFVPQTPEPSAG